MSSNINWNRRKYTEQEFISAWNNSNSIAECARLLGLTIYGSTYTTIKNTASTLGLSRNHMTGQAWLKGKKHNFTTAQPLSELLVENSKSRNTSNLKNRLLKEGLLPDKCSAPFCMSASPIVNPFTGVTEKLKLALDHINGINTDNRLENLRLLCYNCHGMTETFCRGASRGRPSGEPGDSKSPSRNYSVAGSTPVLCTCGKVISERATRCKSCVPKPTKIDWPALDELKKMIEETNYRAVGRQLGVSDNAVRKAVKRLEN